MVHVIGIITLEKYVVVKYTSIIFDQDTVDMLVLPVQKVPVF